MECCDLEYLESVVPKNNCHHSDCIFMASHNIEHIENVFVSETVSFCVIVSGPSDKLNF